VCDFALLIGDRAIPLSSAPLSKSFNKEKVMKCKPKVYVNKTRTKVGVFLTLGNFQKVNRDTTVYYAEKLCKSNSGEQMKSSVFYLIRPKDAKKLAENGYTIKSVLVPAKHYPVAYGYSKGVELTYSN
jgi:hypothetical protein